MAARATEYSRELWLVSPRPPVAEAMEIGEEVIQKQKGGRMEGEGRRRRQVLRRRGVEQQLGKRVDEEMGRQMMGSCRRLELCTFHSISARGVGSQGAGRGAVDNSSHLVTASFLRVRWPASGVFVTQCSIKI